MEHLDLDALCDAFARKSGVRARDAALPLLRAAALELAVELPDADGRTLRSALAGGASGGDEAPSLGGDFFRRLAARAGISPGAATEQGESFLVALAEVLPAETSLRVRKHLPAELARFFVVDAPPLPPPPSHRRVFEPAPPRPRPTLASGRPGSEHPLSEAKPERAHAHSVARTDDPHGDSKLSSARGATQERLHESLAEGTPPEPKRTIAGS